jgi:hypothetical protein
MVLTEEQKRIALDLAAAGKGLPEIQKALGVDHSYFWKFRIQNPNFGEEFARARQEGIEQLADSLLTITRDESDVYKARLQSENIRWLISKRKPTVYGDKIDINLNQTVDIGAALLEAKQRAVLPDSYPSQVIDAEHRDITNQTAIESTDSKSVIEDEIDIFT